MDTRWWVALWKHWNQMSRPKSQLLISCPVKIGIHVWMTLTFVFLHSKARGDYRIQPIKWWGKNQSHSWEATVENVAVMWNVHWLGDGEWVEEIALSHFRDLCLIKGNRCLICENCVLKPVSGSIISEWMMALLPLFSFLLFFFFFSQNTSSCPSDGVQWRARKRSREITELDEGKERVTQVSQHLCVCVCVCVCARSVMSDSFWPHEL